MQSPPQGDGPKKGVWICTLRGRHVVPLRIVSNFLHFRRTLVFCLWGVEGVGKEALVHAINPSVQRSADGFTWDGWNRSSRGDTVCSTRMEDGDDEATQAHCIILEQRSANVDGEHGRAFFFVIVIFRFVFYFCFCLRFCFVSFFFIYLYLLFCFCFAFSSEWETRVGVSNWPKEILILFVSGPWNSVLRRHSLQRQRREAIPTVSTPPPTKPY